MIRIYPELKKSYDIRVFRLAFLHASLLERKKYGPLGWNVGYEFSEADFEISRQQLDYDEIT